jgi:hypothetical protein
MAAPSTAHIVYERFASGVRWWLRTKFRHKGTGTESGGVSREALPEGEATPETRLMSRAEIEELHYTSSN